MALKSDNWGGYDCALTELAYQAVDSYFGTLSIQVALPFAIASSGVSKFALAKRLYDHFDLEELALLAFATGGKFEDVGGENTREAKSWRLVEYMERLGLLANLIETARETSEYRLVGIYLNL